jgi:hypothetical protein
VLCLIAATAYAAAAFAVPLLHAREAGAAAGVALGPAARQTCRGSLALALLAAVPLLAALFACRDVLMLILL